MTDVAAGLPTDQLVLLKKYADAVSASPFSLTSARGRTEFYERHVRDALALRALFPTSWLSNKEEVIDVGSGNGIPGLVLAIVQPNWQVTLLDSDSKKCLFLDTFCKSNSLLNVRICLARAEEEARGTLRETFTKAIARALGPLPTTLELLSGFVKLGGHAVVSRGTNSPTEADLARVNPLLGFGSHQTLSYSVDALQFHCLILEKSQLLDPKYPRRVGVPAKRPL